MTVWMPPTLLQTSQLTSKSVWGLVTEWILLSGELPALRTGLERPERAEDDGGNGGVLPSVRSVRSAFGPERGGGRKVATGVGRAKGALGGRSRAGRLRCGSPLALALPLARSRGR